MPKKQSKAIDHHTPPVSQKPDSPSPFSGQNPPLSPEYGGGKGPEPTRYGDWEKNGRCTDF